MENLPERWQELIAQTEQFRPKAEILQLLFAQLEKDLNRSGLELSFSEQAPIEHWAECLAVIVSTTDATTLQQLFYFVDLPESIIVAITHADNRSQLLSESILRRELVKIYFKLYYSAGN